MLVVGMLADSPFSLLMGNDILALKAEEVNQTPSVSSKPARDWVSQNANEAAHREDGREWGGSPLLVFKKNQVISPVYTDKYLRRGRVRPPPASEEGGHLLL